MNKALLIAALVVIGCSSVKVIPVTEEGSRVTPLHRMRDGAAATDVTARCSGIGTAFGVTRYRGLEQMEAAEQSSLATAQNKLAAMGATHAVYTASFDRDTEVLARNPIFSNVEVYEWRTVNAAVRAAGYNCNKPRPAYAVSETIPAMMTNSGPPVAGCTRDIDCKGDRLCVNGSCVDPPKR